MFFSCYSLPCLFSASFQISIYHTSQVAPKSVLSSVGTKPSSCWGLFLTTPCYKSTLQSHTHTYTDTHAHKSIHVFPPSGFLNLTSPPILQFILKTYCMRSSHGIGSTFALKVVLNLRSLLKCAVLRWRKRVRGKGRAALICASVFFSWQHDEEPLSATVSGETTLSNPLYFVFHLQCYGSQSKISPSL